MAESEDFADALERLRRNATGVIRSWRELAKRLHELDPDQSLDDWKSTINRYRRRDASPREERIELFARAFDVDRAEFPEATVRRRQREEMTRLQGRVATLEERLAQVEEQLRDA